MTEENKSTFNTHHLCWPRKKWNKGYAKLIRSHWYFNVQIPADTLHAEIHWEIGEIPVPSAAAAKAAYEQIKALEKNGALHENDSIELRLSLLMALFECIAKPTANALRDQLYLIRRSSKKAPR